MYRNFVTANLKRFLLLVSVKTKPKYKISLANHNKRFRKSNEPIRTRSAKYRETRRSKLQVESVFGQRVVTLNQSKREVEQVSIEFESNLAFALVLHCYAL